jgi:hypothetical protein
MFRPTAAELLAHLTRPLVPTTASMRIHGTLPARSLKTGLQSGRIERHFRKDARRHVEQSARRFDNLALYRDAAAGKIDDLAAGKLGAFEAASFQGPHPFDHERSDRQQSDDDEADTDAEDRLAAPRPERRCLRQGRSGICLTIEHVWIRPQSRNLGRTSQRPVGSSIKI